MNYYHPNQVIMPVDNQRIDDAIFIYWPDILRYTVSRDNGFRIVTHELFDCFDQASQWLSLWVITCHCD